MRMKYPSIRDTAEQILRDIAAEEQIKTAERHMLQSITQPYIQTDMGRELLKLAAYCRKMSNNTEVSYTDLQNFVAQFHGK